VIVTFAFYVLQMVTTNEGAPSSSDPGSESGTALSKLRQTLSSSLMTAQDRGKSHLAPSVDWISVTGHWPLTVKVGVASTASLYGIRWWVALAQVFRVFPVRIIPPVIHTYTDRILKSLNFLRKGYMWKSATSCDFMPRRLVLCYRRLGTTYLSHLQGSSLLELLGS
jgi:hypothetical protein